MSALSAPRAFKQKGLNKAIFDFLDVQLKANVVVYDGAMIAGIGGYGKPAVTGLGLVGLGVAQLVPDVASITAGSSDGATTIRVGQGVFLMNNSTAGDAITQANVYGPCYMVDDNTVALTSGSGTRSLAGTVLEVESAGVWVSIGAQFVGTPASALGGGAGSVEAIAAAGALSVNTELSTLAVTGTTAYTLANGLYIGQVKRFVVISGASTPVGTVTPATPSGLATITTLTAKGSGAELEWAGAGAWYLKSVFGGATVT